MFTCSIISRSNDNSHFFSILFRVSEYWTPTSIQSARSEKLENRKNTPPLPSNYPHASRSQYFVFFALCVEKYRGCKQTRMKALGPSKVTLKRFWILLQEKKEKNLQTNLPTNPLNRPPNLKLPIHQSFPMLLCRFDETKRLHLRKTPKLKNYSLRQPVQSASPISRQSLLHMHGASLFFALQHVIATWQPRAGISFIIFTNITIIFFLFFNHWSAVITCLDFAKG